MTTDRERAISNLPIRLANHEVGAGAQLVSDSALSLFGRVHVIPTVTCRNLISAICIILVAAERS